MGMEYAAQTLIKGHSLDQCLQAPKFATDGRARKVQHKSREELEEEEMASMPHFKAKPVK